MQFEHWRYFLTLEADLERTFRFVEPTQANFRTYSIEFARLILAACSEVDVVAKVLCKQLEPVRKPDNISKYRAIVRKHYPNLTSTRVLIPPFSFVVKPWREWESVDSPGWWADHNKIKHQRHEHFARADFEHAVVSLSGLFVLLLYLYMKPLRSGRLTPPSSVFHIEKEPSLVTQGEYVLPDLPKAAG